MSNTKGIRLLKEGLNRSKESVLGLVPFIRQYDQGDVIIQQEKYLDEAYVLLKGIVKSYVDDGDEQGKYWKSVYGNGELLGDCEFLFDVPSSAFYVAVTDVEVIVYPPHRLKRMSKRNESVNDYIKQHINSALSRPFIWAQALQETLRKLLTIQEDTSIELSTQEMASCLEVSQEELKDAIRMGGSLINERIIIPRLC